MIEVEAKVLIKNPGRERKKILKLAKYVGREKKKDDYYTLQNKGYAKKSLRVRRVKGKAEVNFKQKLSYVKGVHAKNETEFSVSDIKGFVKLIKDFGYRKWLTKEKETHLFEIKKNFHVELNKVKRLGWFLEVEYLCKEKEVEKARREVLRVMSELGVKKSEIVKSGYTKMLWDL